MTSSPEVTLDRPMPQSHDAERAVLGSILWNSAVLARVSPPLTPSDFYHDAHRSIFKVMLLLDGDGTAIDFLTVKNELAKRSQVDSIGGAAYISALLDGIPDIANVEKYAGIVKEAAQLRALITLGSETMRRAMGGTETSVAIAAAMAERSQLIRPLDVDDSLLHLDEMLGRLETLYEGGGVERGVSTCWPSLDAHYTVPNGAWTLVTGVPGHGKSGFLDNLAINLAENIKWQVVMFSAENFPAESHIASLIEKYLGEPFNEGPTARMTLRDMRAGLAFLERQFRFLDPAAERMSLDRILATASALSEERPVNMLVIDPWNELHHERAKELREDEYISASLTKVRRWARRHRAHVFIVVHPTKMQKGADGRYPVPTPYDCSGGAQWRNKADYCLTVYRELGEIESPDVDIHVQKVRRREIGRLGKVTLRYNKVTSQYEDPNVRRLTFTERVARRAQEANP